jgi:hypothetical protein
MNRMPYGLSSRWVAALWAASAVVVVGVVTLVKIWGGPVDGVPSVAQQQGALDVRKGAVLSGLYIAQSGGAPTLSTTAHLTTTYSCDSLDVESNILYAGMGNELKVYDVTTPATPILLGAHQLFTDVLHVRVAGGNAYVVDILDQLSVLDVSSPATITTVATFTLPTVLPPALEISGTHLYVGEQFDPSAVTGLRAYDISDPSSVYETDFYPIQEAVINDLAIEGEGLYAAAQYETEFGELTIVDVMDAALLEPNGSYVPIGAMKGVAAEGGHVYVTIHSPEDNFSKVRSVDVSSTEASESGSYTYPLHPATGRAPLAKKLAINNGGVELFSVESVLASADPAAPSGGMEERLRLIDVSQPMTPTSMADLQLPAGGYAHDLVVDNDHVYIAFGAGGVVIVSIDRP